MRAEKPRLRQPSCWTESELSKNAGHPGVTSNQFPPFGAFLSRRGATFAEFLTLPELLRRPKFAGKPADGIGAERVDGNAERLAAATARALEGKFVITRRARRIPAHAYRIPAIAAGRPLEDCAFHKRIKRIWEHRLHAGTCCCFLLVLTVNEPLGYVVMIRKPALRRGPLHPRGLAPVLVIYR
jgi:hypothetical protein